MKGIKREFSVARTPKQNVIAKRKNRTLIEAARTMLEDSLLPIPFCAEAVNTTCYVQYRVLVTKPHNKTPYELLLGRTPSIGFMRPFGCPVTILNTLDPLSKFDGKADEGFLVGYSVGSRPTWLFDIDTLTKSMNYQLVVVGNQLNSSAGIQEHFDAEFEEFSFNSTNKVNAASTPVTAVELNSTNSTNNFSAAGPSSNAVSSNFEIGGKSLFVDPSQYPDNLAMPALEEITYLDEDENVGAKADFSNLETNITVSPILTTRVHKDHPVTQMIGDLSLAPQTRSMTRMVKEQGGLTQINNDDFYTCMFTCFPSQEEPKREEAIDYEEVFAPVARIKAIRLFLAYASFMGLMVYQMDVKSPFLYGTIEEKVYVCQPPGFKDPDYPDKVYKVVKPLYGLHQAPRAWYETLANYIVDNGFQRGKINQTLFIKKQKGNILLVQVYVDNIIFGSTNKDLCKAFEKLMKDKFQMSSICELTFFLGLQVKQKQDGIFICQDKYVAKILTKFGLTDGKSASTPIDTKKPLRKDPDGEDVDVHTYKSMIGSLMYLTLSRPNIMFAVCACVRFHVTPKASHLHAVKQIFSYLKGKPHLGLWYPKDSPFNLVAYSNSDYTIVATSSTDAKYVAAASCCAQVLWVQNQLLDYGVPRVMLTKPQQTRYGNQNGNPQHALKDKVGIDSGCSRHITGNIYFILDFEEINGGYIAFGGNPKGSKISGKGKIKTGKLDFDDVYFVKELKFNLFRVSQICDKKNNVLFTETECVILSFDYKLPDDNHILLRVPRENNMYIVDLKNFVRSGDLTCLFAKATLDESSLWHMRLGHINFKTMNKLVKGILVRGLPLKIFENNHTCVACQKGKEHRASWSGPTWLFDIDTLTKSLNYQLVDVGNQPNSSAGIQEHFDTCKVGEGNVQQYVLFPLWSSGSKDPQNTNADTTFEVKEHESEVHVSPSTMPALEEITYSDDDEDVGVEANLSNLETNISVSPIPTTRVHKDHLVTQFIGDLSSALQTRSMTRMVKEQGGLTQIHNDDFHTCMFTCFISQEEPKRVHQTLKDPSWIEAMHEEFLKFKMQKTLFIKKQKGDILLVQVYVDDIIFGSTNKDLCKAFEKLMKDKFQMSLMGELTFFLGLQVKQKHDGIFICQDKYIAEILTMFGLTNGKLASTSIDTKKPLLKDPNGEDVDVHTYRSMIGSLMYLTSSRPDIMFIVCACAHF
nr:putative ribonuclease H-like domain-containing protein [Tanacetum cinerariifolium]